VKKANKSIQKRERIWDQKGLDAFAAHLKVLRAKHGFTQEQLAFESGLAVSQIARIETAKINPSLSTVFAIARAMNIPLKELFGFGI
jgi:transcriptional regulator with XRE-family HTH domain